uniref:ATP-dependent RNA helicase DHX29 DSRM-like domain-containing protein n=1 Tax=Biomphalaria glabrata TaxID=6526 RepID=A0A2C9KM10_BIOGL
MKKSKPTSETQEDNLGLNLFTQTEDTSIVKPAEDAKVEVRNFEYTRSQWTGKSPKQFLIDWVRKHLPKSGPPKFTKIQVKFNQFKSIALVDRQKDGILSVTPDILCNNIKDSEHLAATLALYHLCRGQPVHQLLPPPYRNVWLDWADEEKKLKDEAVEKENKVSYNFLLCLLELKLKKAGYNAMRLPAFF